MSEPPTTIRATIARVIDRTDIWDVLIGLLLIGACVVVPIINAIRGH